MRPGYILALALFVLGMWVGDPRSLLAQNGGEGLTDAQAAMGTAFTYQGRLQQNGQPATGTFDMRFALFNAADGGQQIGSQVTIPQVSVANGVFTARLDFGGNAFRGQARFLETAVRQAGGGNYTLLSPRQELTPGPYALFAGGAPWSGLTGVPNGIADGDDNTLGSLDCTTDQVALFNGSAWVCSNRVKNLTARVTELENLLQHFSRSGTEITISGANLHVVDGTGTTDGEPNGLGNVIIGYNEERIDQGAQNIRTGSHMLVVGSQNNYSSFGGIVVGWENGTTAPYASVSGGRYNVASAYAASVSGGSTNTASGQYAAVSGGGTRTAPGANDWRAGTYFADQ